MADKRMMHIDNSDTGKPLAQNNIRRAPSMCASNAHCNRSAPEFGILVQYTVHNKINGSFPGLLTPGNCFTDSPSHCALE
jgi:hypothetical protein